MPSRTAIGAALEPYGVEVQRVVIVGVQPPLEFMASARSPPARRTPRRADRAARARGAAAGRPRVALTRQRVALQRERIELEAANEALRLGRLESRLAAYPNAARRDVEEQRIEVARSLAGNTRAMVQVGNNADVADALIMHTLTDPPAASPPAPAPASRRTSK